MSSVKDDQLPKFSHLDKEEQEDDYEIPNSTHNNNKIEKCSDVNEDDDDDLPLGASIGELNNPNHYVVKTFPPQQPVPSRSPIQTRNPQNGPIFRPSTNHLIVKKPLQTINSLESSKYDTIHNSKSNLANFKEVSFNQVPENVSSLTTNNQNKKAPKASIETCQIVQYKHSSNVTRTHPEHSCNIVRTMFELCVNTTTCIAMFFL